MQEFRGKYYQLKRKKMNKNTLKVTVRTFCLVDSLLSICVSFTKILRSIRNEETNLGQEGDHSRAERALEPSQYGSNNSWYPLTTHQGSVQTLNMRCSNYGPAKFELGTNPSSYITVISIEFVFPNTCFSTS